MAGNSSRLANALRSVADGFAADEATSSIASTRSESQTVLGSGGWKRPIGFRSTTALNPGVEGGFRCRPRKPAAAVTLPRHSQTFVYSRRPKPKTLYGGTREAALTDEKLIIFTLKDAHRIIAEHLDFGRTRDPEETLTRLIRTLNRPEVASAIEGLQGEHRLRLVE
jgi:hypothetical protein